MKEQFNQEKPTTNHVAQHAKTSKRIAKFVYFFVVGVLVVVCLWCVHPYQSLIHKVGTSWIQIPAAVARPVSGVPILGAVFSIVLNSINWIIGLLLWGFIQVCELGPIYLRKDKAMLRLLIVESHNAPTFEVRDGEDAVLTALKKLYNLLPAYLLKRASQIAIVAYLVDLLIVVQQYPICQGGPQRLNYLLASGQWNRFDYKNITLLLLNLFLVEALVRFLFHFFEFRYYVRQAHNGLN